MDSIEKKRMLKKSILKKDYIFLKYLEDLKNKTITDIFDIAIDDYPGFIMVTSDNHIYVHMIIRNLYNGDYDEHESIAELESVRHLVWNHRFLHLFLNHDITFYNLENPYNSGLPFIDYHALHQFADLTK